MNRPTRRSLLAGAAAACAALPVAARVAGPAQHTASLAVADRAELLERYSAWLEAERLALMVELYPEWDPREAAGYVPADVFVNRQARGGPAPSTRALTVLDAAGIYTGPDTTEARRRAWEGSQAGSDDAELLEACAAFDHLQRSFDAIPGNHPPGSAEEDAADAERGRLCEQQEPLVDRMCQLRAATREGTLARARSLVLWDKELMKERSEAPGERLIEAIVRDLVEEGT